MSSCLVQRWIPCIWFNQNFPSPLKSIFSAGCCRPWDEEEEEAAVGSGKWRQMFLPPPALSNTPLSPLFVAFLSKQWHLGMSATLPHVLFPCLCPAETEIPQLFQGKDQWSGFKSDWWSEGGGGSAVCWYWSQHSQLNYSWRFRRLLGILTKTHEFHDIFLFFKKSTIAF